MVKKCSIGALVEHNYWVNGVKKSAKVVLKVCTINDKEVWEDEGLNVEILEEEDSDEGTGGGGLERRGWVRDQNRLGGRQFDLRPTISRGLSD